MPSVPVPTFEDRLFDLLPDPDDIGTSEYRLLYEHVQETVESATLAGDHPSELLLSSLDEIEGEVSRFRRLLQEALQA